MAGSCQQPRGAGGGARREFDGGAHRWLNACGWRRPACGRAAPAGARGGGCVASGHEDAPAGLRAMVERLLRPPPCVKGEAEEA